MLVEAQFLAEQQCLRAYKRSTGPTVTQPDTAYTIVQGDRLTLANRDGQLACYQIQREKYGIKIERQY